MKLMLDLNVSELIDIVLDKETLDQENNIHNCDNIVDDLISIYHSLENEEIRIKFKNILYNNIKNDRGGLDGNALSSFLALSKLGFSDLALEGLKNGRYVSYSILKNINTDFYAHFDTKELGIVQKSIEDSYQDYPSYRKEKRRTLEEIKLLRYSNFQKTKNFHSIEIDNDKKQVEEYLKDFGFDSKYSESLNLVDKYIANEELDETVIPGGIIGIYRQFFDDFYMDIAIGIAKINDLKEVPENISKEKTSKFGHALAYISKEFGISKDEENLLKGHYGVTNGEGAHKLLSNKKYFRLIKNMSIEIALFMLTKLNDYKNS